MERFMGIGWLAGWMDGSRRSRNLDLPMLCLCGYRLYAYGAMLVRGIVAYAGPVLCSRTGTAYAYADTGAMPKACPNPHKRYPYIRMSGTSTLAPRCQDSSIGGAST